MTTINKLACMWALFVYILIAPIIFIWTALLTPIGMLMDVERFSFKDFPANNHIKRIKRVVKVMRTKG